MKRIAYIFALTTTVALCNVKNESIEEVIAAKQRQLAEKHRNSESARVRRNIEITKSIVSYCEQRNGNYPDEETKKICQSIPLFSDEHNESIEEAIAVKQQQLAKEGEKSTSAKLKHLIDELETTVARCVKLRGHYPDEITEIECEEAQLLEEKIYKAVLLAIGRKDTNQSKLNQE